MLPRCPLHRRRGQRTPMAARKSTNQPHPRVRLPAKQVSYRSGSVRWRQALSAFTQELASLLTAYAKAKVE